MDTSGFSCWSRPVLLALVALAHPCDGLAPAAATGAARRWQCPTATMLQDAGSPVPVTIKEDGSGKCAATQKNIVFLTPVPTWGSSVMRGQLTAAAINDAWAEPLGVRATFCGPKTCDQAVEAHGGASVCVFTKYHWPEYVRKCRRLGALVLWDLIDNQEMANATYLLDHDVDAVVTVSRAHAAYLNAQGVPAVAVPHPHSNLGGWSVAHTSRPRVRGVGFVYADRQSLPSTEDLAFILSSVCAHGAVLYLVRTHNGEINIVPQKCNIQIDEDAAADADSPAALVGCSSRAAAQAARNGVPPQCPGSAAGGQTALGRNAAEGELPDAPCPAMPDLPDSNSQREYYHSSELLRLIDLGLAWRPHRASEDPLMVSFRDGTRLAWWWAHGIPTVGFPTHAHLESALRTGYPVHLLNASTGPELSAVLCSVSRPGVRDCLRQHARRAAELTSPQASARDWLRAICRLGSICTPPTSVVVPRPQDVYGINKSCPFEHPHLPPLLKLHEPSGCLPERHAIARRLQEHWEAIDLLGRAAAANGSYAAQTPFPHTYMDGLFPEWMLSELDREFPDPGAAAAAEAAAGQADDELGKAECEAAHDERGWRCIMDQRGGYFKMTNAAEGHMGPYLQALHQAMKSTYFIRFLEMVSGIQSLFADWTNEGNGMSQVMRGGYLQVHADFNVLPHGDGYHEHSMHRRVNAFVYLNRGWLPGWLGDLELWNKKMTRCEKRIPLTTHGRLIVFSTTDFTYHGHADRLRCPPGRSRRSVAMYYYTESRPYHEVLRHRDGSVVHHSTLYQDRKCPSCLMQVCRAKHESD